MVLAFCALLLAGSATAGTTIHAGPKGHFDLELVDADLPAALILLAEQGDVNIVVPDTVTGSVTLKLRDVTLDAAFNAILAMKGLTAVRTGSTFHVIPLVATQK